MSPQKLKRLLLILSFGYFGLGAQKTAVFNGKTYFVYPHVLSNAGYHKYPALRLPDYFRTVELSGVNFPPVLENLPDGEYLLYYAADYHKHWLSFRKRGKRKVIKDSTRVYGTFTLKNGKKEGEAVVYDDDNPGKIRAVLEYKADMLQGKALIFDDEGKHRIVIEADLKDGVINGKVRKLFLRHGDSIPVVDVEVVNGTVSGKFMSVEYYEWARRFHGIYYNEGIYKNGLRDSVWNRKTLAGHTYLKRVNVKGQIVKEMLYSPAGQLNYMALFGRDTVTKVVGPFSADTMLPFTGRDIGMLTLWDYSGSGSDRHEQDISNAAFFTRYSIDDSLRLCSFIIDGYANKSHFQPMTYWRETRSSTDTVINGDSFRIYKNSRNNRPLWEQMVFIEEAADWDQYRFESVLLQTRYFDKKGHESHVYREKEYVHYVTHDTMQPFSIGASEGRRYSYKEYYQEALDLSFANNTLMRRGKQYATSYFVAGDHSNGIIVKYTEFTNRKDTVLFTDTLMLNGKYQAGSDTFLNQSLNCMLKSYTGRFMPLDKVYHTSIKMNGKPYSGRILIRNIYGRERDMIECNLSDREGIVFYVHSSRSLLKGSYNDLIVEPMQSRVFNCHHGAFNGAVTYTGIFGDTIFTSAFSNNKLDSSVVYTIYRFRPPNRHLPRKERKRRYYKYTKNYLHATSVASLHFSGGMKQGAWRLPLSSATCLLNFRDDRQDGLQTEKYHRYYNKFNMKNDTLDGPAVTVFNSGMIFQEGSFRKGVPHGKFIAYAENDTTHTKMVMEFNDGRLKGELLEYFDSNNLKMKIDFRHIDTNYYFQLLGCITDQARIMYYYTGRSMNAWDRYGRKTLVDYYFESIFSEHKNLKGFYTFYYKQGDVFKQGARKKGGPYGEWKFYREGSRLYKTIWFMDSVLYKGTADSVHVYGKVSAYYDNGNLMFRGYATDNRVQHSCDSDADMPIETNQYSEFYDTLGNSLLINGSGFITEYQASGHKLMEGRIDSFMKEGVWILYSKFGMPKEIGAYKHGKKNGRWLSGDLGGLNLDERICYMTDEEFREWISRFGGDLTLTETYYIDGKIVSDNRIEVSKN